MATNKAITSIQAQLKQEIAQLKERVEPPSGFVISTKGKKFTLPNGASSDGPLNAVVLDFLACNLYYPGAFKAGDPKPPECWALGREIDELQPSANAPNRQAEACKGCLRNEWGSDPGGTKGKACKNTRRLLVVPDDATEETQPWIINVSPTGLKHFDKYINTLADLGVHPIQLKTAISFEPNEAYPSLRFKSTGQHDNLETMWKLKELGQSILHQEPSAQ